MKKYTISDLATVLQLDKSVKEDLRINYENYNEDLKYEIQKVLWDGVHELKNRLAKLKHEEMLLEVDEGKRELTTDLYQQAVKAVWQDFDDLLAGKKNDISQIEEIRSKLKLPDLPLPHPDDRRVTQ